MSLQPNTDIDFINSIFLSEGKKVTDLFKLRRLDNAIKALEHSDPIQGASARAFFYSYKNQTELAMDFLEKTIREKGYHQQLASIKVVILRINGNWKLLKSESENFLLNKDFKVDEERVVRYVRDSELSVDNTDKFMEILDKYDVADRDEINSRIELKSKQIISQGIDLQTYRKILDISVKVINSIYDLTLGIEFRTESLQLIFSSTFWTLEETVELTKNINEAILNEDDVEFQIAADDIEVFCINFSIDKLPEDFVYYEDNDDDLIELIETRMKDNSSPEVDGEELHV